MNINSISNTSYYQTSSLSKGRFSADYEEEKEDQKIGGASKPPQGPPPPKPPEESSSTEDENSFSWDSEDLSKLAEYASSEYGIELDVDSLMTQYDADEDGTLASSEVKSLLEDTGIELPKPKEPPKHNSVDEQMNMMAGMQSTASATTLNIADFLVELEEDEDTTSLSGITSTDSTATSTVSLADLLAEIEDDEENEESATVDANKTTASDENSTKYKAKKLEEMFLKAYDDFDAYNLLENKDSFLA